jgi:hypothetical protein
LPRLPGRSFFFEFGLCHRISVGTDGARRNPHHAQALYQVIHTVQAVGHAKLPGQQLADVFAPHPPTAAFALQLFNRLAKRLFVLFGKALRTPVVRQAGQTGHAASAKPLHPAHDRVAGDAQCSRHFEIALAILEVRQRDQSQSPASIGFLAGQPVEIIGLELINDVLR